MTWGGQLLYIGLHSVVTWGLLSVAEDLHHGEHMFERACHMLVVVGYCSCLVLPYCLEGPSTVLAPGVHNTRGSELKKGGKGKWGDALNVLVVPIIMN